jgi:FkbM family methyltransferase
MMKVKNKIKLVLRRFGIDISRYNLNENFDFRLNHFLKLNNIECIIDIGANVGQYAEYLRQIGFKKDIISFEPLNDAYEILKSKTKKDSRWEAYNFGIGDNEQSSKINVSKNSYSSSILDMSSSHLDSAPDSIYVSNQKITIKRLDRLEFLEKLKDKNLFLKIDTQGYEEQVINGSTNIINRVKGIQIEMSLKELYKDQILFEELYKKIVNLNFDLWDIKRGFSNPKSGKVLQFDAIFFKKNL